MNYKLGERVSWKALNRNYQGEVTGFYRIFAIVRIDGTGKHVLLQNEPIKPREWNATNTDPPG